jgi:hypothetical protein
MADDEGADHTSRTSGLRGKVGSEDEPRSEVNGSRSVEAQLRQQLKYSKEQVFRLQQDFDNLFEKSRQQSAEQETEGSMGSGSLRRGLQTIARVRGLQRPEVILHSETAPGSRAGSEIEVPLLNQRQKDLDLPEFVKRGPTAEQRRQFGWQANYTLNVTKRFANKHSISLCLIFVFGLIAAAAMDFVKQVDETAWFVLFVTAATIIMLVGEVAKPLWVFLISLFMLLVGNHIFDKNVITVSDAFAGFGNADVFAIGLLYIVSRGVKESTALLYLVKYALGRPKTVPRALIRLLIPVVCISAFMNNTPIVAMLIPAVEQWASDCRLESSKLMMPLSFAAILGGMCSKIGTSVNLIADSLYAEDKDTISNTNQETGGFSLFEVGILTSPLLSTILSPSPPSPPPPLLTSPPTHTTHPHTVSPTGGLRRDTSSECGGAVHGPVR